MQASTPTDAAIAWAPSGAHAIRRILRILAHAVVVAATVTIVAFALVRITPGDPAATLLGEFATPEALAAMRERLGLDGSVFHQFVAYLSGLFQGDLGISISYGAPVMDLILKALPVTLGLMTLTTLIAVVLTVPLSVHIAMHPKGLISRSFTVGAAVMISTPAFFLGLLAILVLALKWRIVPVAGMGEGFLGALNHLWLPSLVICASLVPVMTRVLRESILATMKEEFVEVAIVRGIDRYRYITRYLLRPSIAPSINLLSYIIASMFASTVVIELVFNLPGVGSLLVAAVAARDYPIVQGVTLVSGLIVVVVMAVGEMLAAAVDPRTAAA